MKKLCNEARAGIVAWYQEGTPMSFLAKVYDVSSNTIMKILHKENTRIRGNIDASKRLNIDEEIFDKINEESAYWLGFLMADGCVFKTGNSYQIIIGLQKEDKKHLEKFKKFLRSGHKVSLYKNNCKFAFRSKKLGEKLISFGIVPHKGKNGCECSKELANNRHFWRGVIDGDGTLGIYIRRDRGSSYEHLALVGSYNLMCQFFSYVKTICDTKANIYIDSGNSFRVAFRYHKARTLTKHFYKDATIYLERKMQIAQEMMS